MECNKLDLLLAVEVGTGGEVTTGPSFEDHMAMIQERQQLAECMEGLEAKLQGPQQSNNMVECKPPRC